MLSQGWLPQFFRGFRFLTCAQALTACRGAGTPLQNDLQELESLLSFLLPDVFTEGQGHSYAAQEADHQEVPRLGYLPCYPSGLPLHLSGLRSLTQSYV